MTSRSRRRTKARTAKERRINQHLGTFRAISRTSNAIFLENVAGARWEAQIGMCSWTSSGELRLLVASDIFSARVIAA